MKLLKQLFKIFSPSGFEGYMIQFIIKWVSEYVPEAKIELDSKNCNIYITKGESEAYPCVVAHLDQVQKNHSADFVAVETRDIIFGYSPRRRKHEGLGADDKVGIWCGLKLLQKFDNLKVAFFSKEETGCLGAGNANMEFFQDCRFVLEADRRGSDDMVVSIWDELCSQEFIEDTDHEMFGYKISDGMTTDVGELKGNGLGISCINISCGYYEPHTDQEYVVKKDVRKALRFMEHIIRKCTKIYPHLSEDSGGSSLSSYWEQYDEAYDMIGSYVQYDPTLTPDDLYLFFHSSFPKITREEFADMLSDIQIDINKEDEDPEFINFPHAI